MYPRAVCGDFCVHVPKLPPGQLLRDGGARGSFGDVRYRTVLAGGLFGLHSLPRGQLLCNGRAGGADGIMRHGTLFRKFVHGMHCLCCWYIFSNNRRNFSIFVLNLHCWHMVICIIHHL